MPSFSMEYGKPMWTRAARPLKDFLERHDAQEGVEELSAANLLSASPRIAAYWRFNKLQTSLRS
jgi:hypothetical protein